MRGSFKRLAIIGFSVQGLLALVFIALSLTYPVACQKDLLQDYLMARAIANGINPYLNVNELSSRFIKNMPYTLLDHPSPHPPLVGIICLPLLLFDYHHAVAAWAVFEALCLFISLRMILRVVSGYDSALLTLWITLMSLGWYPILDDLLLGQLMVLLLLVLTISWQALRSDKLILGGIALGIAICLKIVAWPLVILLALRKKWQAVISAGVTVLTVNLIIALTLGFNVVLYYYQHVAGQVYPFWRSSGYNISVVSLGWKLFAGTSSLQPAALNAPPLIPMPGIAPYASGVMLLVVLIGGLAVARKRSFDVAFGMMACVSAIISPIAWDHYLVLAVIAISAAVKSLALLHYPKDQVKIASLLFLLLIIPIFPQRSLAVSLLGKDAVAGGNHWALIPLAWSGFIPLVASLALIWFMNRLDQQVEKACSGPADSRLGCESEVRRPERC